MSKDPAFLFYDGDAARDVSHMNRLERGCYFDLIQAQRKFHGITIEQARKILGKDFETCWSALELILFKDGDLYYIEWVSESMEQRKKHAEQQRKRIQDYWDKKKQKPKIPRNNHGKSMDLPLVNEDEIEDEIEEESNNRPTVENFIEYFKTNGYSKDSAITAFNWYDTHDWCDRNGDPVKNWKNKVRQVWFKEANRIPKQKMP
jgi:hypothetical protein